MRFMVGDGKVTVNVTSKAMLLGEVTKRLRAHSGFAIATLNLDHLVKLRSADFRRAYAAQDLVTADGNPIVWTSRIARQPVELVTGSDLVLPLARLAAAEKARIALFGSDEETLKIAAARLTKDIRGLDIALTIAPPMGFSPQGDAAKDAIAKLRAAEVQLVFVALGAPKQETFAALGRQLAPEMGFASIGAGLDFIAGTQKRAPEWARRLALEWLWRMLTDPKRLAKRYAQCLMVLPGHMLNAARQREEHSRPWQEARNAVQAIPDPRKGPAGRDA